MSRIANSFESLVTNAESATSENTSTGPFDSGQSVNINIIKINNLVTLQFPEVNAAAAAGAVAVAAFSVPLTVNFRPTVKIVRPISIRNNATLVNLPGKVIINTNGTIQIYADMLQTGLFSIIGNNGWEAFSCSYLTS